MNINFLKNKLKFISRKSEIDRDSLLIFIGMLYTTIFFSSFILGYKGVQIGGGILCASVFIFPLLFPINDSISELISPRASYFLIIFIIICEFLFSLVTYCIALLPSPTHWDNQSIYPILTSGFLHIAIADSISLAIGFFANTYIFSKWGLKIFGTGFFRRSLGATAIGELLFTISTNFITFHGLGNAGLLDTLNIIGSDYAFKMLYSLLICIPNAYFVQRIKKLKYAEHTKQTQNTNVFALKLTEPSYRE